MIAADAPRSRTFTALLAVAMVMTGFWLWICWCLFPLSVWNDVRLAPTLALARGGSFYPGESSGAVTTWIYGPLPVLALWPAAWAHSAAHALEIAGAINILSTVAAIVAVCAWWPAPAEIILARRERALAAVLALTIWPFAAFQYLQADNLAIALGLAGNLVLVRTPTRAGRWAAAGLAVAGLACKQTSVGIAAAQIVWLAMTVGPREAGRHLGRCAACGLLLVGWMLAAFDWEGLRINLFTVPMHLPWAPHPLGRILDMAPQLSVHLVLPALILFFGRQKIWARDSVLLLPSLAWLLALPSSAAAFMKFGGTLNSLQSFTYWLPPALLAGLAAVRTHRRAAGLLATAAFAAAAICGVRCVRVDHLPIRPLTEHYREAAHLANVMRGEIWFPWNPLVTIYSENRFYHVEDGLCMRFLAGHALTMDHARQHLPANMCVIALPRGGTDWGIALRLAPPNAQADPFGLWTLHSWPPPAGAPAPRS
jgi:hypothetical protein